MDLVYNSVDHCDKIIAWLYKKKSVSSKLRPCRTLHFTMKRVKNNNIIFFRHRQIFFLLRIWNSLISSGLRPVAGAVIAEANPSLSAVDRGRTLRWFYRVRVRYTPLSSLWNRSRTMILVRASISVHIPPLQGISFLSYR